MDANKALAWRGAHQNTKHKACDATPCRRPARVVLVFGAHQRRRCLRLPHAFGRRAPLRRPAELAVRHSHSHSPLPPTPPCARAPPRSASCRPPLRACPARRRRHPPPLGPLQSAPCWPARVWFSGQRIAVPLPPAVLLIVAHRLLCFNTQKRALTAAIEWPAIDLWRSRERAVWTMVSQVQGRLAGDLLRLAPGPLGAPAAEPHHTAAAAASSLAPSARHACTCAIAPHRARLSTANCDASARAPGLTRRRSVLVLYGQGHPCQLNPAAAGGSSRSRRSPCLPVTVRARAYTWQANWMFEVDDVTNGEGGDQVYKFGKGGNQARAIAATAPPITHGGRRLGTPRVPRA